MKLSILMILYVSFLSACASHKLGEFPLTESERRLFAQANPDVDKVLAVAGQIIEVTNHTFPASYFNVVGFERGSQIYSTVNNLYPRTELVYRSGAEKFCAGGGLFPDEGVATGPNTRRFSCLAPVEWSFFWGKKFSGLCLERQGATIAPASKQLFHTLALAQHPCDTAFNRLAPSAYCETYSQMFGIELSTKMTCSEFVSRFKAVELEGASVINRANRSSLPQEKVPRTIEQAVKSCTDLGFIPKTEKYGDCVLRMSK